MNSDRELLEMAAKAAGVRVGFTDSPKDGCYLIENGESAGWWNPLTDDGDAFRLAVKLRLKVRYHGALGQALVDRNVGDKPTEVNVEDCGRDECAATRRAIVRAAAELGKAMSKREPQ